MPSPEAPANIRRYHRVVIDARTVRRRGVSQSSGFIEVEGETSWPPVETRNAGPWGAVKAAEEGETKRPVGALTVACDRRCISNVGRTGGGDEDINVGHGGFQEGGWRSALDRIWFWRPFHLDCEYGEIFDLSHPSPKNGLP